MLPKIVVVVWRVCSPGPSEKLSDFLEVKQIFTDGTGLAMKPAYGQVIKEA